MNSFYIAKKSENAYMQIWELINSLIKTLMNVKIVTTIIIVFAFLSTGIYLAKDNKYYFQDSIEFTNKIIFPYKFYNFQEEKVLLQEENVLPEENPNDNQNGNISQNLSLVDRIDLDEIIVYEDNSKQKVVLPQKNFPSFFTPCPIYLSFSHIESGGIGYDTGYSTIRGTIYPSAFKRSIFPFLDLRYHIFNDGHSAANIGLGTRIINKRKNKVLGINTYIDYRDTPHHSHLYQAGFGLEFLTCRWDLRANGYFPIHDKHLLEHCFFNGYIGPYFIQRNKYEEPLFGCDSEIGVHLFRKCCLGLYFAAGPYYFRGHCINNVIGGEGRLRFEIRNFCLEAFVSSDNLYGTKIQGMFTVTIPLGCTKCSGFRTILDQSVHRNEIIVSNEFCKWKWNW